MFYIIILLIAAFIIYRKFFKSEKSNNKQEKTYSNEQYSSQTQKSSSEYYNTASTDSNVVIDDSDNEDDPFKGWSYDELEKFVEETKEKAQDNDLTSIRAMVHFYLQGFKNIVVANKGKAMKYMRMGADLGDMELAFQYAVRLNPEDIDCRKYMKMAADSGNAEAAFDMFYILIGSGSEDDQHLAAVYLNNACDAGYSPALDEKREILKQAGHSDEEVNEIMSKHGNSKKEKELESVNGNNVENEELTDEQIKDLMKKLKEEAESGNIQSMIWLGDIYEKGQGCIQKNERMALKYWKMAADHGNTDMAFKSGILIGRLDDDYSLAFRYIKISADAGNRDAMYVIHNFLKNGWGCEKNSDLAYKYLKKSADAGQNSAIEEIEKW